jgi:protein SCO1/2
MTMPSTLPSRRSALGWLAAAGLLPLAGRAADALPGNSVYQLRLPLTDQDGQPFELLSLRGRPVLVSMFYNSCEMVCPMIFQTLQMTLDALPAAEQQRVRVLMVSFDPARDSVAVLKARAQAHQLDARWTLARTDDANARKFAALLSVQYRRLASGEFNHSSSIALLDAEGRITGRTSTLAAVDPQLLKSLRQAISAPRG